MKKYLPLILLGAGILVLVAVYFLVIRPGGSGDLEDENVPEIPFEKRPYTTLTPKEDGHWLKMRIVGIKGKVDAATMDYELIYKTADGRTQGVPGTVALEGQNLELVERDLLLGSESSGKFRYDEGVEQGTLTLRFRNDTGKLTGKLVSDFRLQKDPETASSVDGKFKYTFSPKLSKVYVVTMTTLGVPGKLFEGTLTSGPYGVFASDTKIHPGAVQLSGTVNYWDGSAWVVVTNGKASTIGVFVGTAN